MQNLNKSDLEFSNEPLIQDPRVGNKFYTLFRGEPLDGNIHKVIAKSFIDKARTGVLQFLEDNNLNFNEGGLYQVKYSLLQSIYLLMDSIGAKYLKFSFVEIDKSSYPVTLTPHFSGNDELIYIVVSLQDRNEVTIEENNYLIINSNINLALEDLKISDYDLDVFQNNYRQNYLKKLDQYFSYNSNQGNTTAIYYYIGDLEDMLNNKCDEYEIYLCEISNVLDIISTNGLEDELNEMVYERHFASRENQITLVAHSDDTYFDMGSLRP